VSERADQEETAPVAGREGERGSGLVEWLGISALSVGVLVALFAALEAVGLRLIEAISGQLGF
jgi:hypothetical protein